MKLLFYFILWNSFVRWHLKADKVFLLDTTTKSSLDWPHYRPHADASETSRGWLEESYSHEEKGILINWRSYVVCDVAYAPDSDATDGQNGGGHGDDRDNWLRTPLIPLPPSVAGTGSRRLYVEVTFNMRDCGRSADRPGSQNGGGCKETFEVAYNVPRDHGEGYRSVPAWHYDDSSATDPRSGTGWTLLDRLTGTRPGNITARTLSFEVGPTGTDDGGGRGFYLAFHDTGACLSLLAVRVYALSCPRTTQGRSRLDRVWTGPDLTSVVPVTAACVAHASSDEAPLANIASQRDRDEIVEVGRKRMRHGHRQASSKRSIQYLCKADGTWFAPSNKTCKCDPGYRPPSFADGDCTACPIDTYKHSTGDYDCSTCPVNSVAPSPASTTCACLPGYFRPSSIFYADSPCAPPPPAPTNLSYALGDDTSAILTWQDYSHRHRHFESVNNGTVAEEKEEDNYYLYRASPVTYRVACDVCDFNVRYSPGQLNLNNTRVTISHLKPGMTYNFIVYAENELSQLAGDSNYASIIVKTENSVLEKVAGFEIQAVGINTAELRWAPTNPGGIEFKDRSDASSLPLIYEIIYKRFPTPTKSNGETLPLWTDDYGGPFETYTAVSNSTNATLYDLIPASLYTVKIRAKNVKGVGDYSQTLKFKTLPLGNEVLDDGILEFAITNTEDTSSSSMSGQGHHIGFIVGGALITLLTAICLLSAIVLFIKRKQRTCKGKSSSDCDSLDVRTGPEVMTPLFPPSFFKTNMTSLNRGGETTINNNNTNSNNNNRNNVLHSFHNRTAADIQRFGGATPLSMNHSTLVYGMSNFDPLSADSSNPNAAAAAAYILNNVHASMHPNPSSCNNTRGRPGGNSSYGRSVTTNPYFNNRHSRRYVLSTTNSSCTLTTEQGSSNNSSGCGAAVVNNTNHTYEDPNRLMCGTGLRDSLYAAGGVNSGYIPEIDETRVMVDTQAVVGRGEFGEVCRAILNTATTTISRQNDENGAITDDGPETVAVAIKTLKPGSTEKTRADFLAEARIMAHFGDANVIRLIGMMGRRSPTPAIVTEYMENGALDIFLRNNEYSFRISQLLEMLRGIASGMRYLSELSFVHRDLAARNILVNRDLICKVSDFGLSREIEGCLEGAYTTKGGKIPVRWTAPEAIAYRRFSTSSDVWSYGVLAWEVISYGDRPYWNWSNQDVVTAVDKGYRLPPPMYCPEIVHLLMLKCWMSDPKNRSSFRKIVEILDKIAEDEESQGLPATFKSQNYDPFGIDSFNTVEDWLNSIKMGRYAQTFERAGIISLETVVSQLPEASPQALLDRLGIVPLGHRNKILLSARSLQYPFSPTPQHPTVSHPNLDGSDYFISNNAGTGHTNLMMFGSDGSEANGGNSMARRYTIHEHQERERGDQRMEENCRKMTSPEGCAMVDSTVINSHPYASGAPVRKVSGQEVFPESVVGSTQTPDFYYYRTPEVERSSSSRHRDPQVADSQVTRGFLV